jgi:hypothetical protein
VVLPLPKSHLGKIPPFGNVTSVRSALAPMVTERPEHMKPTLHFLRITIRLQLIAIALAGLGRLTVIADPADSALNPSLDSIYRPRVCATAPDVRVAVTDCGSVLISKSGEPWRPVDVGVRSFFRDVTYQAGQFVLVGGSYVEVRGVILTSKDGENWAIRRCGIKTVLHAVTFGEGQFIAVGDQGMILRSKDGEYWKQERSNFQGKLTSVAHGNDRFVAAGQDGVVLTSPDGRHWFRVPSGVTSYLNRVEFNGRFVLHMPASSLISSNGVNWEPEVRVVTR